MPVEGNVRCMDAWTLAGEPPDLIKTELCITQLSYYLDVNAVDENTAGMDQLRRARLEGWIRLQKTDTLDTELLGAPPDKLSELLRQSAAFAESFGPMVLDHSRLDRSVLASSEDVGRLAMVVKILKPGVENQEDLKPNDMRDAMHVATSIRYGGTGFITRDLNLLRKAEAIRAAFNHFQVCDPENALQRVAEESRLCLRRKELGIITGWLPKWLPKPVGG